MSFAEARARIQGEGSAVATRIRTLVRAGGLSKVESMVVSAVGERGNPVNLFESHRRAANAREAYREIKNWVYACTNCIARRIAGQQWQAGHYEQPSGEQKRGRISSKGYDREKIPASLRRRKFALSVGKAYGGAEIEPDETHQSLWLLDEPNRVQGKAELVYMTVMNLLATGEWYWIGGAVGKGDKARVEVWAVPTASIEPDHSQGLYGGFNLLLGNGQKMPIPAENVAHGYFPDPSDIKGVLSPLAAAIQSITIDGYILTSQLDFMKHGINPKLALVVGENPTASGDGKVRPRLSGAQRKQISRAIRVLWSQMGPGDPAILDGLIGDVKKLQNTPQEMDWKQSADQIKARILQAFGVNGYILGDQVPGSYAQANLAENTFAQNVCNPIIEGISCEATRFLSQFYEDGDTLAVWLENCTARDEDREMRKWQFLRQQGDVTQDENRSWAGLPPAEEEPETPERSPLFNNPQTMAQVTALAAQVSAGALSHDNAVKVLVVMLQITEEDAGEMLPDDPPEPPPMPALPQGSPPNAPTGQQTPPAPKPAQVPPASEGPEKTWNEEDHPRDASGRFGSGGGSESGSLGESPVNDEAAAVLDQWTTPATGSREGEYEAIRQRGAEWVGGKEDAGFQALYDETQERLAAAGIKEIESFRGMDLPADHPLAKAIADGKLSVGAEFSASGMTLNSWSESKGAATHFADNPATRAARNSGEKDSIGIVIRRVIDAKDIVSGARIHSGFLDGEQEVIARNTGPSRVQIIGIYKKQ